MFPDDTSSCNDDEDNLSERSNSLTSTPRNSQLRLTFNKAFDKWRGHNQPANNHSLSSNNSSIVSCGTNTMPATSNQESPGESLSRLSRWFSIRRGSTHQYDLNASNQSNSRSGSVEKSFENDDKVLCLLSF